MTNLNLFVENGKKIIGVAANYKSLLKILDKPMPKVPEIFIKPTTSYITEKENIVIPKGFSVNEEVELGVIIGKIAKKVSEKEALDYVGGYCVALDMTATCKMKEARSTGGSWTLGKGFDTATPVGSFIKKSDIPDPHKVTLWCSVNGKHRQDGCTDDLAFSIPVLISFISQYITLEPNDLILTGSPPDMGPVQQGDIVRCGIKDISEVEFKVEAE
ncbi:acylpyruvase FAHD1, mitochondrial [Anoplophora glabripennis]|uniref:acylpyruvase FAHD1, mitochondrial n=1 Tax=Anoplophora glabripennis TaxID=217634 RepID=UPI000874AD07|nr:acylpyruvase FAHD1, mitochondrial [Anoplophora glabripennis]